MINRGNLNILNIKAPSSSREGVLPHIVEDDLDDAFSVLRTFKSVKKKKRKLGKKDDKAPGPEDKPRSADGDDIDDGFAALKALRAKPKNAPRGSTPNSNKAGDDIGDALSALKSMRSKNTSVSTQDSDKSDDDIGDALSVIRSLKVFDKKAKAVPTPEPEEPEDDLDPGDEEEPEITDEPVDDVDDETPADELNNKEKQSIKNKIPDDKELERQIPKIDRSIDKKPTSFKTKSGKKTKEPRPDSRYKSIVFNVDRSPAKLKPRSPEQKLADMQKGRIDRREQLRSLARTSLDFITRTKLRTTNAFY